MKSRTKVILVRANNLTNLKCLIKSPETLLKTAMNLLQPNQISALKLLAKSKGTHNLILVPEPQTCLSLGLQI